MLRQKLGLTVLLLGLAGFGAALYGTVAPERSSPEVQPQATPGSQLLSRRFLLDPARAARADAVVRGRLLPGGGGSKYIWGTFQVEDVLARTSSTPVAPEIQIAWASAGPLEVLPGRECLLYLNRWDPHPDCFFVLDVDLGDGRGLRKR